MEIRTSKQYNQGIGKYKVLSSNAGVGSIIATKWGGFIMPMSSSLWDSVKAVTDYIIQKGAQLDISKITEDTGVELVEDSRFASFLRENEQLSKLTCFMAIPSASLSRYNTCDVKDHPLNKKYRELHPSSNGLKDEVFTIPATVFPRWFFSRKNLELKTVSQWLSIWRNKQCNEGKDFYFAPPRDPNDQTGRKHPAFEHLSAGKDHIHNQLEQISMVLICPEGHISDIPWDKYFCAYNTVPKSMLHDDNGFDLFDYDTSDFPCEGHDQHNLQLIENRSHAESFGLLKCSNCGRTASLEGIMNLKVLCRGEKPWEGGNSFDATCKNQNGRRSVMRWAMVTSNSVYYAENFSSLYIPDCLRNDNPLNPDQQRVLKLINERWFPKYNETHSEATIQDFFSDVNIIGKAYDSDIDITENDVQIIKNKLCPQNEITVDDVRENYRHDEYSVFIENIESPTESDKLTFKDIEMPMSISPYFSKIQQVDTLAITSTQMNFSRVSMPQPKIVNGVTEYPNSMKIFKEKQDEVRVMPAIQSFGEGLFFSFDKNALDKWVNENQDSLNNHLKINPEKIDKIYKSVYDKMAKGGIPQFYLLHTFSHVIMKELEFSCGYPTASLKERLYFSDRMCGVLIYTADGAEGSMGGLVWQGQPTLIENIIMKAMKRAVDCASDPICWENEDQLNFAACFSCAMVSETSCEERNLGLDRRVLVDEDFGFFKDVL